MYTNNIKDEKMDNLTFIKKISERIDKYKYIYKLGSSQRYYFRIDQISYSKEWKKGANYVMERLDQTEQDDLGSMKFAKRQKGGRN